MPAHAILHRGQRPPHVLRGELCKAGALWELRTRPLHRIRDFAFSARRLPTARFSLCRSCTAGLPAAPRPRAVPRKPWPRRARSPAVGPAPRGRPGWRCRQQTGSFSAFSCSPRALCSAGITSLSPLCQKLYGPVCVRSVSVLHGAEAQVEATALHLKVCPQCPACNGHGGGHKSDPSPPTAAPAPAPCASTQASGSQGARRLQPLPSFLTALSSLAPSIECLESPC